MAVLLATNAQVFRYGYAATTDALALALQAGALALLLTGTVTARRAALAGAGRRPRVPDALQRRRAAARGARHAAGRLDLGGRTGAARAERWRSRPASSAPVLPWVGFSLLSGAHFAFQLHHNVAYEVFAHARGITWDTYQRSMQSQFPTPWSVIARDPGAVLARVAFNVFDHVRLDARLLDGAAARDRRGRGAVARPRATARSARLAGAWLAAGLLFLTLVPAFHSERYSLAVLPAWAALAALALTSPRLALRHRAGRAACGSSRRSRCSCSVPSLRAPRRGAAPGALAAAGRGPRGRRARPAAPPAGRTGLRAQAPLRLASRS